MQNKNDVKIILKNNIKIYYNNFYVLPAKMKNETNE